MAMSEKLNMKEVYESYRQDIYYYLISLTKSQQLSEDLTSEVFVSAVKSFASFRGDSDIKTWLFSIARYKWFEHIRKEKKELLMTDRLADYLRSYSANGEKDNEISERVLELLEQEKENVKTTLIMRAEGYSFYEIGAKLNISESSARVLDFRARKKIREILEKEGYVYE